MKEHGTYSMQLHYQQGQFLGVCGPQYSLLVSIPRLVQALHFYYNETCRGSMFNHS
jgi:hypothetical protein